MSWTIWHNPRCRKSRETLQILRDNGVEPEIRLYLENTPTREEIDAVTGMLGVQPRGLMRTKESLYRELGLRDPDVSPTDLVGAMVEHPSLIERPVVVTGERAVLGRPPENVLDLL